MNRRSKSINARDAHARRNLILSHSTDVVHAVVYWSLLDHDCKIMTPATDTVHCARALTSVRACAACYFTCNDSEYIEWRDVNDFPTFAKINVIIGVILCSSSIRYQKQMSFANPYINNLSYSDGFTMSAGLDKKSEFITVYMSTPLPTQSTLTLGNYPWQPQPCIILRYETSCQD
jgi:hypothetical protein